MGGLGWTSSGDDAPTGGGIDVGMSNKTIAIVAMVIIVACSVVMLGQSLADKLTAPSRDRARSDLAISEAQAHEIRTLADIEEKQAQAEIAEQRKLNAAERAEARHERILEILPYGLGILGIILVGLVLAAGIHYRMNRPPPPPNVTIDQSRHLHVHTADALPDAVRDLLANPNLDERQFYHALAMAQRRALAPTIDGQVHPGGAAHR